MGLRQKLNGNPALALVVMLVLCGVAAGIWYMTRSTAYLPPTKAFYTTDDGDTLFVADVNKVTPFEHEGKQAVKAYVYTCDGGKTRFVGYLERMPDGAKQPEVNAAAEVKPVVEKSDAGGPPTEPRPTGGRQMSVPKFQALIRKPGQTEWIKPGDPRYFPTMMVKCPDGKGVLDRVMP